MTRNSRNWLSIHLFSVVFLLALSGCAGPVDGLDHAAVVAELCSATPPAPIAGRVEDVTALSVTMPAEMKQTTGPRAVEGILWYSDGSHPINIANDYLGPESFEGWKGKVSTCKLTIHQMPIDLYLLTDEKEFVATASFQLYSKCEGSLPSLTGRIRDRAALDLFRQILWSAQRGHGRAVGPPHVLAKYPRDEQDASCE